MADTDMFTPEECRAWRALSGVLTQLPSVLDAQLAKDAELTLFEYTALARLAEAQHRRLSMSKLAELTRGSLSRLSHVTRRLEARDLVRRQRHGGDARITDVVLLPEGRRRARAATPAHTARVRELVIEGVDPADLAAFSRVGEHILDRLAAENRDRRHGPQGGDPPS